MLSLVNETIDDENNSDSEVESDIDFDFEQLNADLDEIIDSRSNDSDSHEDQDSRSTSRSSPEADRSGSWSTIFAPVEVEEFTEFQGLKVDLTESSHPRDYFDLFFPPELISRIVDETNKYAKLRQG